MECRKRSVRAQPATANRILVVLVTIVCWPYHGPSIKAATRARWVDKVTSSPRVAAGLASLHAEIDFIRWNHVILCWILWITSYRIELWWITSSYIVIFYIRILNKMYICWCLSAHVEINIFQQFQFIPIIFNIFQRKQSYFKLVMTSYYIYMHFNHFNHFKLCPHISLYFNTEFNLGEY